MNCPNGRVNLLDQKDTLQFNLMDKIPINHKTTNYKDALNGNLETSVLSNTFFSSNNIIIIQHAIKKEIHVKSGKIIDNQNEHELKIIMRSTYLQWSINDRANITKQIEALNKIVIDYCVKTIYSELVGYYKYREDISTLAIPHDLPVLSNSKNKTLELKPWF